MSGRVSFAAWEDIGFTFPNLSLPGVSSMAEARAKVAAGTHRWVCAQGMTLSLVPIDYILRDHEFDLRETEGGGFEG